MDAHQYGSRVLKAAAVAIVGFATVCGLLILFSGMAAPVRAAPLAKDVSGDILTDTVWTTADSPIIVTGTVTVISGTLTISPGVTVKFNNGTELIVQGGGNLIADGTDDHPITFTSNATPTPGSCDWGTIRLFSDNNIIRHSIIEYARWGIYVEPFSNWHDISHNTFRRNGLCQPDPVGAGIAGSPGFTTIDHNQLVDNNSAIYLVKASNNTISSNVISGTTSPALAFVESGGTLSSRNLIFSNTIRYAQDVGLFMELGYLNVITHNMVYSNYGAGIRLVDQDSADVLNNIVYGNAFATTTGSGRASHSEAGIVVEERGGVDYSVDVDIENNIIYGNGASGVGSYLGGLYVTGTESAHIVENFIHDNVVDDGFEYGPNNSGSPEFIRNAICRNPSYELHSQQAALLTAEGNWWGTNTPDTPVIEISGNVDYDPWIQLAVTPASRSIVADGVSTTTLYVTFNDGGGRTVPPPARDISVTASAGTLSSNTVTVDDNGQASLVLTSTSTMTTAIVTATERCGYAVTDTVTFGGVDMSVSKTASPPPYGPGDPITYTISYRNNGNTMATGVVLTETLPVSTTFVGPSGWAQVGSTDQYTMAVGDISPLSGTLVTTFIVSISDSIPPGNASFTNVAQVGDDGALGSDHNPVDNVYTLTISGGNLPDLWAVKNDNVSGTGLSGPMVGALANTDGGPDFLQLVHTLDSFNAQAVPEGGLITYTVGYGNSNDGTLPATGVVLSETLPLYTGYAGPPCGQRHGWCQVGATRIFTRFVGGPLNPGVGDWVYFTVRVNSLLPPSVDQVINTVCIYGNEDDLVPSNNCSTEETDVITGTYDLSVTKVENALCLNPGDALHYQITVSNLGANDATNAVLQEMLPANTTAINPTGSGWADAGSGVYTYSLGIVPSGVITSAQFWVQIDPDLLPNVTSITNVVSVQAEGTDSNPTNNSHTWVTPIGTTPDLAITKNDNILDSVDPGGVISYTIAYVNDSHRFAATNVIISDTLPLGTIITGSSASLWNHVGGNVYTYIPSGGDLAPREAGSVELMVQLIDPISYPYGSEVVNRVEIGGAEAECNTANNTATEETPVTGADATDLEVSKVDNVPFCAVPGDLIQYTITYTNNSYTVPAENVELTETIDMGAVAFSGPSDWSWIGGGDYTRSPVLSTVDPREGGTFTFNVEIADNIPGGQEYIVNEVRIDTTSDDWNLANNVYTLTTYVPEWPDLFVVKNDNVGSMGLSAMAGEFGGLLSRLQFSSEARALLQSSLDAAQIGAMAESVNPGDTITYTIILGNVGRADAGSVVLTDTLPAGTSFVGPWYWQQVGSSNLYTYAVGTLNQGAGDVLQFIVRVDDPFLAGNRVINLVEIGSNHPECNTADNSSTDETPVEGAELSNKVYLPIILKDYPEGPPPPPAPTPTPTPEPVPLAWVSDVVVDPATERVFVASPRQDVVQVIDGVADEYSDNVPVGHGPTGLAVLTSTTPSKVVAVHAYAYNYWAPGVWFINASSLASHSMTDRDGYVGAAPIKVAVNSITDRAFVSNYYDRMALLIAPNETWIAGLPEKNFQASYGVDASQLNNLIHVAARDSGELIIFDGVEAEADPGNYSPCHHAPPGADNWHTSRILRMVAVNNATGHVFVTSPPDPNKSHQADSKVFVLDEDVLLSWTADHGGRPSGQTCLWNFGVTGGDVGTTAIPGPAWIATVDLPGAVSAGEEGIAVNPVTGRVYVTDGAGDQLFVLQDSITPTNINLVTRVDVGDNPQGVDVNPESNKVYVANAHDANAMNGTVSVVDGVTNVVSKTIELAGTR